MRIPYILEFDFTYGQLQQISPNVRRLVANNPGPFSGWGTNVYFIGTDDIIVIDPGPNTDAHFDVLRAAIGTTRVRGIFVTHHHKDHSPMAPRLGAHFDCPTYSFGAAAAPSNDDPELEAGNDTAFTPDILLRNHQYIKGDGWAIRAMHTPGHTSNHMCYAIEPEHGLICGDHVLGWSTSIIIPPDGKMAEYIHSLHTVLDMKFAKLWPGHGPEIPNPDEFLKAYLAHRQMRNTQILTCLQNEISHIKDMIPAIYPDLDPRLIPAACISVLSHLIDLVEKEQVACTNQPSLDTAFFVQDLKD